MINFMQICQTSGQQGQVLARSVEKSKANTRKVVYFLQMLSIRDFEYSAFCYQVSISEAIMILLILLRYFLALLRS